MGSLMSGWSSTVLGDKKVGLMRNRSLTKEEVDAFWRQHGRPDSGQAGSPLGSPRRPEPQHQLESRLEGVRSLPSPLARGVGSPRGGQQQHLLPAAHSEPSSPAAATRAEGFPENAAHSPSCTTCDWWTTSSWAFPNEPQQQQEEVSMSGRAHKAYACDQFHVSRIVTGNA